ncbi:hypothetical protein YB2330_003619 [Saitoella coloradoensis]
MSNLTSLKSTIKLNSGHSIPCVHLGVYEVSSRDTYTSVSSALNLGYRAIDSAEWYGNEAAAGRAIRDFCDKTGTKREEVWFTTKLKSNSGYEATKRAIRRSLEECGLEYIDLYLIHSPYGGKRQRLESWEAMEEAVDDGMIRSIGVSNYGVSHLRELLATEPQIPPAINQIEVHPFNTRVDITSFCVQHGIVVQAYAPLAKAMRFNHPVLKRVASKVGKTPAQVLVRWSLEKGYVPLPKSVREARMKENADVFGWGLEDEDVKALDGCDEYLITDWDPTNAD